MKLILDPEGTAIDLAKAPLSVEAIKVTPGKKKIDLVTSPYTDGAVPFGKSATDVMVMEIELRVDEQATLEEALAELRAVSQLLDEVENQLPGGMPLEETPDNSATPSTAYVLMGEITELPREMSGDQLGWYHKAPFARITLTCEPFYEGPEVEAGSVEGETPLLELTINNVKGDVDALGLAVVTAKGGQNLRHVEIGRESRFYDSAKPNATLLKAEAMETAGYAGAKTAAAWGNYSAQIIKATLVNQPVVVCATGPLAHIGQWREKLRFLASTTDVYVRLAWRVGDGPWGRGDWVKAAVAGAPVEQFLDSINIPQAPAGTTQRWEGRLEAMALTSGATIEVDILESIPAEAWQQVRAPSILSTAKVFKMRDDFVGAGVFMTGTKEEMNNTYVKLGHAEEDADDFLVVATEDFTSRAVAGPEPFGRAVGVAVGLGRTAVSVDMAYNTLTDDASRSGFLCRVVNSTNYLKVQLQSLLPDSGTSPGPPTKITVQLVTAGVVQKEWTVTIATSLLRIGGSKNWLRVLAVVVGEEFMIFAGPNNGAQPLVLQGFHASLGTTLANGGVYLWDRQTEITATSRGWTRLRVWEPEIGVVAYSGRDLRIDYQTAERYDSEGKYLSPVYEYRGKDFVLPASGDRKRKVRIVSKARINDVDNEFDTLTGIKHKLAVFYRPRYRFPRDS